MSAPTDSTFNIGVSRKLLNTDMTPVITEVDFSPILDNPAIRVSTLPDIDTGELTPDDVRELDAAILFLEKVNRQTVCADR